MKKDWSDGARTMSSDYDEVDEKEEIRLVGIDDM